MVVGLAAGCAAEPAADPAAPDNPDRLWVDYEERRALEEPRPGQRVGRRVRVQGSGRAVVLRLIHPGSNPAAEPREDTAGRGRLTSAERKRLEAILAGLRSPENRTPEDHPPGPMPCRTPASSVRLTVHTDTAARTVGLHRGCDPARYPEATRRAVRAMAEFVKQLRARLEPPDEPRSKEATS